ncbi:hypothetical protein GF326_05285 [Candidatus Bathyarchaeota archaeon]|nr:hypothetical protein [Candidatus Bathyarchaeota archaeon]
MARPETKTNCSWLRFIDFARGLVVLYDFCRLYAVVERRNSGSILQYI